MIEQRLINLETLKTYTQKLKNTYINPIESEVTELSESLAVKANVIPFNSDKYVTNPVGNFGVGEKITGLSIAEIFAKLLGLSDEVPGDIPSEDENEIVQEIISKQLSMYSVNNAGSLAASDFKILNLTADSTPVQSGFYQIVEDNKIIESGYQDLTIKNENLYYVIALPKNVEFDIKQWDDEDGWTKATLALRNDTAFVEAICVEANIDISGVDQTTYTIWAVEEVCTGGKLRYVIK